MNSINITTPFPSHNQPTNQPTNLTSLPHSRKHIRQYRHSLHFSLIPCLRNIDPPPSQTATKYPLQTHAIGRSDGSQRSHSNSHGSRINNPSCHAQRSPISPSPSVRLRSRPGYRKHRSGEDTAAIGDPHRENGTRRFHAPTAVRVDGGVGGMWYLALEC